MHTYMAHSLFTASDVRQLMQDHARTLQTDYTGKLKDILGMFSRLYHYGNRYNSIILLYS